MSGMTGHAIGHLVRRGVQAATNPDEQYIQHLKEQSQLYETAFKEQGPSSEVQPWEILLPFATYLAIMVLYAAVC